MIEERISRIKSSHILQSHIPLVSTVTVLPALCTLQPNLSSTKSVLSTSRRYGQFFKVHTPSAITVAASIGSTAFFAPCTPISPLILFPPSITSLPTLNTSHYNIILI